MAVRIKKMRPLESDSKVKAFFSISLGPIDIDDCRLISGKNGLFVGFPSKKVSIRGEETYLPIVSLSRGSDGSLTSSATKLSDEILEAAKDEYERRGGDIPSGGLDEEENDLPF